MREILFRGKLKSNDEWAYGNLQVSKYGANIITPDNTPLGRYGQVYPTTVGQYTGLKDKNGVKIFEGDIVHYRYEPGKRFWNVNQSCVVSFQGYGFHISGIMGTNKYACMSGWLSQLPIGEGEFFEVIGNIHDNPGLLKSAADYADNDTLVPAT